VSPQIDLSVENSQVPVDQGHSFDIVIKEFSTVEMGKELYVGTFVHSLSLKDLEVGENSVIGIDNGKIVFVEKDVKDLEAVKKAHGYEGAKICIPQSFPI